ncbi:type II toxin-antitoxin system HicB family antitoxin [Polaribacter litorisediminis]|uniref:type II toxin-antitoxin system HicB family antitoxin n=1 Tax=Polaribacter litorisediminis TaxID=1908341 RepID=UPI001CBE1E4F|nr:type II toxin-antitoxin system HicB family antitoxin [Polaribacter litorisediminis]UAM99675.1 type II toxin-antitoxin system HicB family antitoxin [Polaribacter litorisediminis]
MQKNVNVSVEKHKDGTYWGTTSNIPGVVSAFGSNLSELKESITLAYKDYYELAEELEEDFLKEIAKNPTFKYHLDIKSVFELLPEVKISNIAEKAGINTSLLRQYKTGKKAASEEQANKVLKALHELGQELLSVSFG